MYMNKSFLSLSLSVCVCLHDVHKTCARRDIDNRFAVFTYVCVCVCFFYESSSDGDNNLLFSLVYFLI